MNMIGFAWVGSRYGFLLTFLFLTISYHFGTPTPDFRSFFDDPSRSIKINGSYDISTVKLSPGDSLILSCLSTDAGSDHGLNWTLAKTKYENRKVSIGSRLSVSEGSDGASILSLKNVEEADMGSYTCGNGIDSLSVYLYVRDESNPNHIFISQASRTFFVVYEKEEGYIGCLTNTPDAELSLYVGTKKMDQFDYIPQRGFRIPKHSLPKKFKVQQKMTCKASINNGQFKDKYSLYVMKWDKPVDDLPKPVIDESKAQWAYAGGELTLVCLDEVKSTHLRLTRCDWNYPAMGKTPNPRVFKENIVKNSVQSKLRVTDLRSKDSGNYTCTCTNMDGKINFTSIMINVSDSKEQIQVLHHSSLKQTLEASSRNTISSAEFFVVYAAYPDEASAVRWLYSYYNTSGDLVQIDVTKTNLDHETSNTNQNVDGKQARTARFTLLSIKPEFSGNYTANIRVSSNVEENTTFQVEIQGQARPSYVSPKNEMYYRLLHVGKEYPLTCDVFGLPLPRIKVGFKPCLYDESCGDFQYYSPDQANLAYPENIVSIELSNGTFGRRVKMNTLAHKTGTFKCLGHNTFGNNVFFLPYIVTDIPPSEEGVYMYVETTPPLLQDPPLRRRDSYPHQAQYPKRNQKQQSGQSGNTILPLRSSSDQSPSRISRSASMLPARSTNTASQSAHAGSRVYTNDLVTLVCKVQQYDFEFMDNSIARDIGTGNKEPVAPGTRVKVAWQNGTYSTTMTVSLNNIESGDTGMYYCSVRRRGTMKTVVRSYDLTVNDPVKPRIDHRHSSESEVEGSYKQSLHLGCEFRASPTPDVFWYKDGFLYAPRSGVGFSNNHQTINFSRLVPEDSGTYECIGRNRAGYAYRTMTLKVTGGAKAKLSMWHIILMAVFGFITLVSVIASVIYYCFNARLEQRRMELLGEMYRQLTASVENRISINPMIPIHAQAENLPYDFRYEVPKESVQLGPLLGQGQFGKVHAGTYSPSTASKMDVAIKMPRGGMNIEHHRALLSELKIMIYVGQHVNILNLVGAITKHISVKGELFVLTEMCHLSSLDNYLRSNRGTFINEVIKPDNVARFREQQRQGGTVGPNDIILRPASTDGYLVPKFRESDNGEEGRTAYAAELNSGWPKELDSQREGRDLMSTGDLLEFSYQIANGMEYLAAKNIIHRDLATRNLLLTKDLVLKISDFGLARNDENYTIKKTDVPLPIKWMAVEAIRYHQYTVKSDVWSFGVTLWEIFALGENPYPGMEINDSFLTFIKSGNRMTPPPDTPSAVDKLMSHCWLSDPKDRPTFTECKQKLAQELKLCSPKMYEDLGIKLNSSNLPSLPSASASPGSVPTSPNIDNNESSIQNPHTYLNLPFDTQASTFGDSSLDKKNTAGGKPAHQVPNQTKTPQLMMQLSNFPSREDAYLINNGHASKGSAVPRSPSNTASESISNSSSSGTDHSNIQQSYPVLRRPNQYQALKGSPQLQQHSVTDSPVPLLSKYSAATGSGDDYSSKSSSPVKGPLNNNVSISPFKFPQSHVPQAGGLRTNQVAPNDQWARNNAAMTADEGLNNTTLSNEPHTTVNIPSMTTSLPVQAAAGAFFADSDWGLSNVTRPVTSDRSLSNDVANRPQPPTVGPKPKITPFNDARPSIPHNDNSHNTLAPENLRSGDQRSHRSPSREGFFDSGYHSGGGFVPPRELSHPPYDGGISPSHRSANTEVPFGGDNERYVPELTLFQRQQQTQQLPQRDNLFEHQPVQKRDDGALRTPTSGLKSYPMGIEFQNPSVVQNPAIDPLVSGRRPGVVTRSDHTTDV